MHPSSVPSDYQVAFTADVYFTRIDTTTEDMSIIFNYTFVVDVDNISSIGITIVGSALTESLFILSNGAGTLNLIPGQDGVLQTDGSIRDSIILNNPTPPLSEELYSFTIGTFLVFTPSGGVPSVVQVSTTALIDVIPPSGKEYIMMQFCLSGPSLYIYV